MKEIDLNQLEKGKPHWLSKVPDDVKERNGKLLDEAHDRLERKFEEEDKRKAARAAESAERPEPKQSQTGSRLPAQQGDQRRESDFARWEHLQQYARNEGDQTLVYWLLDRLRNRGNDDPYLVLLYDELSKGQDLRSAIVQAEDVHGSGIQGYDRGEEAGGEVAEPAVPKPKEAKPVMPKVKAGTTTLTPADAYKPMKPVETAPTAKPAAPVKPKASPFADIEASIRSRTTMQPAAFRRILAENKDPGLIDRWAESLEVSPQALKDYLSQSKPAAPEPAPAARPQPEGPPPIQEGNLMNRGNRDRSRVTTWDYYDDEGDHYPQTIYLQTAWHDDNPEDPDAEPVPVYRWESHQEDAGEIDHGEWTRDKDEARTAGVEYAEENHQERPDSELDEEEEPEPEEESPEDNERAEEARQALPRGAALTSLLGAPEGATVSYSDVQEYEGRYGDSIPLDAYGRWVNVKHPMLESYRSFVGVNGDGEKFVWLDLIIVSASHQGQGLGAQILESHARNAKEQGFAYLQCHAAGNAGLSMNGYYTWPVFGYDMDVSQIEDHDPDLADAIREEFPDAESVLDLMETPEGREWWKENGNDLHDCRFDLSEGSTSWKALEKYLARKRKK